MAQRRHNFISGAAVLALAGRLLWGWRQVHAHE